MSSQDGRASASETRDDGTASTTSGTETGEAGATGPAEQMSVPSDAFQALGSDVRTGILETLAERTGEGTSSASFSELFEASDVDTTAGFAYHLRQLEGSYVRKVGDGDEASGSDGGEGYELTYAGRRIAREIAAGTYTHRVDRPSVALEDPCPFCDRERLEARSRDNVVTVSCAGCDRTVLDLGFPPSGLEAHGEEFPDALDRFHRHRLGRMRDGLCPDCGGTVAGRLVEPSADVVDELPAEYTDHVQAELECESCGTTTRCPVSLTLLDHAAVVSFYRDHGREVDDRPIWNVGAEWAEAVLSEDPFAVRVVVELEDDVLALYVDEDLSVVDVQRATTDQTDDADAASDTASESETETRADASAETVSPQPEPNVDAGQPADSATSSGS